MGFDPIMLALARSRAEAAAREVVENFTPSGEIAEDAEVEATIEEVFGTDEALPGEVAEDTDVEALIDEIYGA